MANQKPPKIDPLMTLPHLYALMEETFKPQEVYPSTPLNDIMYRAGQRSVVDWVYETITSDRTEDYV